MVSTPAGFRASLSDVPPIRPTALLALLFAATPRAAPAGEAGRPPAPPPSIPNHSAAAAAAGEHPLPPGAPADQALWKAAIDAGNDITVERARATRLQFRLKGERYAERLDALAGRPDPAGRAQDLRRRVEAAWRENHTILTARWPVDPTRACGYYALTFYAALTAAGTPADQAVLAQARVDLRACMDKAAPALRAMRESTDRLEVLAAEADGAFAAAGMGSPLSVPEADPGSGRTAQGPPAAAR